MALSFPDVNERLSHGEPCFFVRNQRVLCYFRDDHNGDCRISMWCPARPQLREELVSIEPDRFFLDLPSDDPNHWNEVRAILEEAFRIVAPKSLVAQFDQK
jgi:hypothetical protein